MLVFSRRLLSSLQPRRCFSSHRVVGTFGDVTEITKEDRQFITTEPQNSTNKDKPLVILFGWAGAKPKNLSKYGQLYSHLGCPTIEFILPTRFIFRHTEQIFDVLSDVHKLRKQTNRKTIVHCLSDTGVMSFQGLCVAAEQEGEKFLPDAIVWDSCPGPRPRVTLPRTVVLTAINWFSRMRDGMTFSQAVMTSAIDFRDLGWRNFIRKGQGLEAKLSTMDDIWCGYWARNLKLDVPELFIYSGSDFYIPASYIEGQVIPDRNKVSRNVLVCKFNRSPHVEHLRKNRVTYTESIKQMVEKVEKK